MSVLNDIILLTGGSGFIGSTTLSQLLKSNYTDVRTTVRDKTKQEHLVSALKHSGITDDQMGHLHFFIADLLNDAGWKEAITGVKYVLHIASPIAFFEKDKVKTALEGTLRVLKFARDNGVKRVVATSSGLTYIPLEDKHLGDYHESKIVAEKAGWDFIAKEGGSLELVTIHPGLVLGPVLGPDNARQIFMIQELLKGKTNPFIEGGDMVEFADVRDVADLHIRALAAPGLAGKKLNAWGDKPATWKEVTEILRNKLPDEYAKVIPVLTKANPPKRVLDNSFSKTLGWKHRGLEETVIDSANSLIALGLMGK